MDVPVIAVSWWAAKYLVVGCRLWARWGHRGGSAPLACSNRERVASQQHALDRGKVHHPRGDVLGRAYDPGLGL